MATDLYAGFAERYDLFYREFAEHDPAATEFYRQLFALNGVKTVLDCACGTGHDLHLFHTLGVEVEGSDVSESMLSKARQNLAVLGLSLPLHQLDYRELPLHFDERFDVVTCLSTSIAHMPDEANVLLAFESMRSVLREGGLLVLSQGTSDRQWAERPRFILANSTRDLSRLFVIDYYAERSARYNIVDIFHGEERREMIVWSTDYACVLLRDDQERLLRETGFSEVQFYGSYSFEPYDKMNSGRLITVAQK